VSDNTFDESSRALKSLPLADENSNSPVLAWSPENQSIFAEALLNPPAPNEALRRAFALRENLLVNAQGDYSERAAAPAPKRQD